MNTIEEEALPTRRRRRRYTEEFKARVVAACQGTGVSVSAVALEHRLNANLLRRWLDQAEGRLPKRLSESPVEAQSTQLPAFVPVAMGAKDIGSTEIRVEVRRGNQSITVSWPVTEAAQCATWLREWLR
ncbi:IS66-like element accessory protein TnpA [Paraburkholderia tropica]|uniref:IS66-like element accessory protein TnpA n=1 Tax=Paraburkholderia tropica TaxID=92647 RepID=UPI002AAF9F78|nr:transposase [Paraburkholderia tropica]